MPAFLVEASKSDVSQRVNRADGVIVFAADAADARAMAQARFSGDGNPSWAAATATQIVADPDYEGWRLRVRITPPTGSTPSADLHDVTYTGAASDTMDLMGAGIEALLDAAGLTATYTSATQVLIAATGSGTDDLGDHTLTVEFLPPLTVAGDPVAIPGFVASGPTHEGVATANLDVTFEADAYVVPLITGVAEMR